MKTKKIIKIISLLVICVVFVGALVISSLAATSQNNVEIYKKNIIFGEKLQLMFAIDAPEYVDVTAVCGDKEIDIEYIGNQMVEGKECLIYRTVDGWAPQNINATVTVTATANGQTDVLTYSVLMYLYERLNLDNLDPVQEADRIAMYEALLAYAKATDKVINSEDGKTPHDFDSYHYVSVVNGTLDGYNDWGMYKEGETPFANIEHIFDLTDNDIVEWTYSLNGEDMGWIDYEDLKSLALEGAITVTATRAIKDVHTAHDRCQPVGNETELEAAFKAGGKYYLTADIEVSKSMSTSSTVELCLNGHILSAVANEEVFSILSVSEGGKLVLNDCDTTERVGYVENGKWIEGTKDGAEAVTLTGGIVMGGHANLGAAIWAKGDVEIYNVDFVNNTVTERGGAIYAMGALNISGANFVCNEAGLTGGAIHGEGGITFNVTDTAFIANVAKSTTHGGGALYVNTNAVGTFRGVTLIGNTSHRGGAVALHSGATLTVYSLTAKSNSATANEDGTLGVGGVFILNAATLNLAEQSETDEIVIEGNSAVSGGAIHAEGSATVNINGAEFKNNSATGDNGGAINAKETSTVTVSGNSKFIGNTTTVHGGAISATKSTITVEGNAEFTNNTATNHGGAIYLTHSSNIGSTLTMTGGSFNGNSAMGGGAVSIRTGSSASFDGTEFTSNSVEGYADTQNGDGEGGGAIYAGYGSLTLKNVTMSGNTAADGYGGAVNVIFANLTVEGGNFTSNSAVVGGAIRVHKCVDTEDIERKVTISGAAFTSNSATYGGAIYASNTTATVSGATFTDNKAISTVATNGGAISATDSTLTVMNCTFDGNSVSNGSATNNQHGGAIYTNKTTLTVSGTTFTDNISGYYGGAIAADTSDVSITGGSVSGSTGSTGAALWFSGCAKVEMNAVSITGNTSKSNGVVYINSGTENKFTDLTVTNNKSVSGFIYSSGGTLTLAGGTYSGNSATSGGVICIKGSGNVIVEKNGESATVFDGNSATNGGAIYVESGSCTVNGATFKNNSATEGGAIYTMTTGSFSATDSSFEGNTAKKNGGAVAATGTKVITFANCTFTSNQALSTVSATDPTSIGGGAIYVGSGATVTVSGGSFNTNSVVGTTQYVHVGGAVLVDGGTLNVSNALFDGNTANNGAAIGTSRNNACAINATSCTFNNNVAALNGGGIYLQHAAAGETDTVVITDCSFDKNAANSGSGASVYSRGGSGVTIVDVSCSGGSWGWKGEIYITSGARLTISGTATLDVVSERIYVTGSSTKVIVRHSTEDEKTAWTDKITLADSATISYVDVSAE